MHPRLTVWLVLAAQGMVANLWAAQNAQCSTAGAPADEACVAAYRDVRKLSEYFARSIPTDADAHYRYLFQFRPEATQDLKTGKIYVDLKLLREQLLKGLNERGIHPDAIFLQADGGAAQGGRDIPVDLKLLKQEHPVAEYQGGPVALQQYVRIVLKEKGKVVHISEHMLIEKPDYSKINPSGFHGFPEASLDIPGVDTHLVPLTGRILHSSLAYRIDPAPQFQPARDALGKYGPRFQPTPVRDAQGRLLGWDLEIPPGSGQTKRIAPEGIRPVAGAAFSQHDFDWDSKIVAESLADNDPETALNTLVSWLDRQGKDGSYFREADYKGRSFQLEETVKFGKPIRNFEYYNPPLTGWAWQEVYRWNPRAAAPYLDRAIQFMEKQVAWLESPTVGIAKFDEKGKLVALRHTNVASGEDNSPVPLDEFGLDMSNLSKYGLRSKAAPGREKAGGSVALLSQYLITLKAIRDFKRIEGRFADAQPLDAKIGSVTRLLRDRYRDSKTGWYLNLVPVGERGWEQAPIETLAGWWAIAAGVATPEETRALIKDYLRNPDKFGGPFLSSVPHDNPYYRPEGPYWRGGGWPPQWRMVSRSLRDLGMLQEAQEFDRLHLAAMNAVSRDYVAGNTPDFLVEQLKKKWPPNGVPPGATNEEVRDRIRAEFKVYAKEMADAQARGQRLNPEPTPDGTVYEYLGLKYLDGKWVPDYGKDITNGDNTVHRTRKNFTGWGGVVPKTIARSMAHDAVPAFQGPAAEAGQWLYTVLRDPAARARHQLQRLPSLGKLADWIDRHPQASYEDFAAQLVERGRERPDHSSQLALFRQGYVEVRPVFDPQEGHTVLRDFVYDGTRYTMKIDRLPAGEARLTVESPRPIRVQFAPDWQSGLPSSDIVELGGSHPSITLPGSRK